MTAIAEAEAIEVTDEEMVEALAHTAEHERTTPEKLLERLRENGRDAMISEDIRARKAIELVADAAKPIPLERRRREQIGRRRKPRAGGADSCAPRGLRRGRGSRSGKLLGRSRLASGHRPPSDPRHAFYRVPAQ